MADTTYGTGHFQINAAGWLTIAIMVVGLVAGLWCAFAAANVARWHASHGTRAIPGIPVPAAAVAAAVAVFVAILVLIGRQSSATGHMLVFTVGMSLAAAAWFAVMTFARTPADQWRTTQAFAGEADKVLGHGYPGTGRVRGREWQVSADGSRRWPGRLVCRAGPGWQGTPSEHAALNRAARKVKVGWPAYTWSYDPMRKQVIGVAAAKAEG